jgi:beta-glucosidase
VEDDQFYGQGVTILEGIRHEAPTGVEAVDYLEGFDIHGNVTNMDKVLDAVAGYDVVVAAIGEHVYTEGKDRTVVQRREGEKDIQLCINA